MLNLQFQIKEQGDCSRLLITDNTDYTGFVRSEINVELSLVRVQADGNVNIPINYNPNSFTTVFAEIEKDGHYKLEVHPKYENGNYVARPLFKNVLILCRANQCFCKMVEKIKTDDCGCDKGKETLEKVNKISAMLQAAPILFNTGNYNGAADMLEYINAFCEKEEGDCGCD